MVIKKGKSQVTFVYQPQDGGCQRVELAGTFNDWQPQSGRMAKQKDGSFRKRIQLPPGEYRYKFIVDGQWQDDPEAEAHVTNEFGTQDALVRVG